MADKNEDGFLVNVFEKAFRVGDRIEKTAHRISEQASPIVEKAVAGAKHGAETVSEGTKQGVEKLKQAAGHKESDEGSDETQVREKLDDRLKEALNEYNAAYAMMNDKGNRLYFQRERAVDLIDNVENLINSIANHPKEFDTDIAEIDIHKGEFKGVCEYAKEELEAAKKSAMGVGAGVTGGAAVAALAPSAAMWVATTFGTASTGTAISALSGAAATNAALAWLGGGAIAGGGAGMAGGEAFLALAGPVGWGIAGATLLASIVLFANKKMKLDKQKKEEIESVLKNTESIKETDEKIRAILEKTENLRDSINSQYNKCLPAFDKDFMSLSEDMQMMLGTLVNETKGISMILGEKIGED